MEILFFCTRWGSEDVPWETFLKNVKEAGYDGVETSLPLYENEIEWITNAITEHGLKFIGVQWDTVEPDFDEHMEEYEIRLRSMAKAKPMFITSHTGKDYYTFEQNKKLLELAQQISLDTGVPIIHETHRGKFSYAAHITKPYLEKLPWLKLTLDISHWCTVAESYLVDQAEAVDLALLNTRHIHSRVGYTQGPQITDPRAPEWKKAMQFHLNCWDRVIDAQRKSGAKQFTFTSEFGPPPYMPLQPFFGKPVASQWEINRYMKDMLKQRYATT